MTRPWLIRRSQEVRGQHLIRMWTVLMGLIVVKTSDYIGEPDNNYKIAVRQVSVLWLFGIGVVLSKRSTDTISLELRLLWWGVELSLSVHPTLP